MRLSRSLIVAARTEDLHCLWAQSNTCVLREGPGRYITSAATVSSALRSGACNSYQGVAQVGLSRTLRPGVDWAPRSSVSRASSYSLGRTGQERRPLAAYTSCSRCSASIMSRARQGTYLHCASWAPVGSCLETRTLHGAPAAHSFSSQHLRLVDDLRVC